MRCEETLEYCFVPFTVNSIIVFAQFPSTRKVAVSLSQIGKIMAKTKQRVAVAHHFFNDFDTAPAVLRDLRIFWHFLVA